MAPPVGSLVILHNQALALLPQFYLGSALIVGGFKAQQQLWRTASLQAQILAVVAEVAWTGLHPEPLPQAFAAWALLGALLLNALHLSTLYGLVDGLDYTPDLAFGLALACATQPAAGYLCADAQSFPDRLRAVTGVACC